MKKIIFLLLIVSSITFDLLTGIVIAAESRVFPDPPPTTWKPYDCRRVPPSSPAIPNRTTWRSIHADGFSSDEVSIAFAPMFQAGWIAEEETWSPVGPVFDSDGNLYFVAFLPYENLALISLNADDGSRRFVIPNTSGATLGSASPLVLNWSSGYPNRELIIQILDNRAFAVLKSGTIIWDVPVSFTKDHKTDPLVMGVQYLPFAGSVVAVSSNGIIIALSMSSGEPVAVPFHLPGEPSPSSSAASFPPEVENCANEAFAQFVDPEQMTFTEFAAGLMGNGVEVANSFSVDATRNRLWIAATAPDEEDGTVDGISEYGALYRLDVQDSENDLYSFSETCHLSFSGGSATTPTLTADGTRIYIGDNNGKLIAVASENCSVIWELDLGSQIVGSVAVASDNGEIYAATNTDVFGIVDTGDSGEIRWLADIDGFETPLPSMENYVLTIVGIGANAVQVHIGLGIPPNLLFAVGVGQIDRATGDLRFFTPGPEESVAAISMGPDGALYLAHSPIRRILTECLVGPFHKDRIPIDPNPLSGGIVRYGIKRADLLIRDAVCAGRDRALNAFYHLPICRDSAVADSHQIEELVEQAINAIPQAVLDGDMSPERAAELLDILETALSYTKNKDLNTLSYAAEALDDACLLMDGCNATAVPTLSHPMIIAFLLLPLILFIFHRFHHKNRRRKSCLER